MEPQDLPRPSLVIAEPDFRLVRVEIGNHVEHVLEVRDAPDAMGGERWRKAEINGTAMKAMFSYVIRLAYKSQE